MYFFSKQFTLFLPIALIMFFITSCSTNSNAVCNKEEITKINEIVNNAGAEVKDAQKLLKSNKDDSVYVEKLGDIALDAARQLNAYRVTNQTSLEFKSRLFNSYQGTSKAAKDYIKAVKNNNREAAENAGKDSEKFTEERNQILKEMSTNCNSK